MSRSTRWRCVQRHVQQRLRCEESVRAALIRWYWLACVLLVLISPTGAHAQSASQPASLPAQPFVLSAAQQDAITGLNTQFRPRFQALTQAVLDSTDVAATRAVARVKTVQAEYDAAYRAILTPAQQQTLDQVRTAFVDWVTAHPKPQPPSTPPTSAPDSRRTP